MVSQDTKSACRKGAMLTAFLAHSGGRVVIPDAVAMVDGETYDEVQFVSADGRTLVVFRRADLSAFTHDGDNPIFSEFSSAAASHDGDGVNP